MTVFLLCLVIASVVFLLVYSGWQFWYSNLELVTKLQKNKDNIISAIYKGAKCKKGVVPGSESLKITILETLNISPDHMRECLKQLKKEKLVIESNDAISLTTFGVQFYEIFIRNRRKKKK